ncbi:MAG: Ig-like domain-containing protein [Parvularcula sp.]
MGKSLFDSRITDWLASEPASAAASAGGPKPVGDPILVINGDSADVEVVFRDISAAQLAVWIDRQGLRGVTADDFTINELATAAGTTRTFLAGSLPRELLDALANTEDDIGAALITARPLAFSTNAGSVTSEGDVAEHSDDARANFFVDGTGIKVGVLSDSMNASGSSVTYADDIASGDLPAAGVEILQDAASGSDEGRAMAQIVHDVAPGADIAFHTAFAGQANFAQGIVDLFNVGSQVIVDDVIYFAEPFFQDGIIAQAVDTVVAGNASYYSSAGNNGDDGFSDVFNDSGIDGSTIAALSAATGGGALGSLHDWNDDPTIFSPYVELTAPSFSGFTLSFQWDEPFASAGGAGSTSDLDIFVTQVTDAGLPTESESVVDLGFSSNVGADAVEIVGVNGVSGTTTYRIYITEFDAPDTVAANFLAGVFFGSSGFFEEDFTPQIIGAGGALVDAPQFGAPTSFGHANAAGAQSVGASAWFNTPAFNAGLTEARLNSFSSLGGYDILFDAAGNRLAAPDVRDTVDYVAPDGGNNTFFGGDSGADADSLPNFFGTSAAAPHAAAVAALLLEADGSLTPAQLEALLEGTASPISLDNAGRPVGSSFVGTGLIDANAAMIALAPTIAIDDLVGTDEDTSFSGDVLADNGLGADFDLDATLSVSAVNGQPGDVGTQVTLASGALLTVNADGTFDYDPNGQFEALNTGDTATDSFTYTISDGGTGSDTATVTLTIDGVDEPFIPIIGTPGNDTLIGTPADEFIDGLAGNDSLNGKGGNDSVVGGDGNDTVRGQDGDDTVEGGAGADQVRGDDGADLLDGGPGNDNVQGGLGNDTIIGGPGVDLLKGDAGDDQITDLEDGNRLFGGSGNDTLTSGDFDDTVRGDVGIDVISTAGGNDKVFGGRDDDVIDLGDGDDRAQGDDGNDMIFGGAGLDRMEGNAGDDTILGGDGNDSLIGKSGADVLLGEAGDDRVDAGTGNDLVEGGAGNDFIRGGAGLDTLDGGIDNDTIDGGADNDVYVISLGDGVDELVNFDRLGGDDVIEFRGFGTDFDEAAEILAASSQVGSDVLIDFGTGQLVTLVNVQLADFAADDITFG